MYEQLKYYFQGQGYCYGGEKKLRVLNVHKYVSVKTGKTFCFFKNLSKGKFCNEFNSGYKISKIETR